MAEKKRTENTLKTDPVSVMCQTTGIGRDIAEQIIKRAAEQAGQPEKEASGE